MRGDVDNFLASNIEPCILKRYGRMTSLNGEHDLPSGNSGGA
jgi:hypothetical protein